MPDTDIASAARRVAARFEAAKRAGHTDVALRMSEVVALLPVLDAVAAGQGDEGRVERFGRAIAAGAGDTFVPEFHEPMARAAIALADAERAADLHNEVRADVREPAGRFNL